MDRELRYKQHIARTVPKGLAAALALKRLKMLFLRTARQLFVATVAPVMDYAANVWMHACGENPLSSLNRAQKIGPLAITGAFRTVATAVAEAEASIPPIRERFPVQKIARAIGGVQVNRMETIREYAMPLWELRLRTVLEPDREKAAVMANEATGIVIATSSSLKRGIVGVGGIARDTLFNGTSETVISYVASLGTREEQNPYTAELAAIAMALEKAPASLCSRFSRAMDTALPGKHTRDLYDNLKRREACILAQLRTGMARLNGFLNRIGAVESNLYACTHASETVTLLTTIH
ncbi:hypothetical protein GE09DRAFT_1067015 [Coniochaeta sp. 2T2.1]|nr:hypothetical protein GE09DRAFT_1067015 [Coniochaeta sp. 2T2.1]